MSVMIRSLAPDDLTVGILAREAAGGALIAVVGSVGFRFSWSCWSCDQTGAYVLFVISNLRGNIRSAAENDFLHCWFFPSRCSGGRVATERRSARFDVMELLALLLRLGCYSLTAGLTRRCRLNIIDHWRPVEVTEVAIAFGQGLFPSLGNFGTNCITNSGLHFGSYVSWYLTERILRGCCWSLSFRLRHRKFLGLGRQIIEGKQSCYYKSYCACKVENRCKSIHIPAFARTTSRWLGNLGVPWGNSGVFGVCLVKGVYRTCPQSTHEL